MQASFYLALRADVWFRSLNAVFTSSPTWIVCDNHRSWKLCAIGKFTWPFVVITKLCVDTAGSAAVTTAAPLVLKYTRI